MNKRFPQSRKLILLLGDIFLTIVAVYLATKFIVLENNLNNNLNFYFVMTIVLLLLMGVLFNVNGLFTIARKKFSEVAITLAVAVVNEVIIMMAICFFVNEASYSRVALLLAALLQFAFLLIWRNAFWRMERALAVENQVAIIGGIKECQRIRKILAQKSELSLIVCSIYTNQEDKQWQNIADDISDELPQLFNVLKGDMSIVDPRPERPIFVQQFTKEISEYSYRHNVKTGITGLI